MSCELEYPHASKAPVGVASHELSLGGIAAYQQTAGSSLQRAFKRFPFDASSRKRWNVVQRLRQRRSIAEVSAGATHTCRGDFRLRRGPWTAEVRIGENQQRIGRAGARGRQNLPQGS